MLTFTVDSKKGIPIYKQLYLFIKEEIQSKRMIYNQKLPSKRKLSEFLGISQNTVQTAYSQLMEEGYITSVEKKGYYVCRIENIIQLDTRKEISKLMVLNDNLPIKFDFSFSGVDHNSFPYAIWRKLYKETVDETDKTLLQLSSFQGNKELRVSIAQYLHQSRGVNCSADQIVISSGTEFLIQLIILLFSKRTVYGLENPGYEKPRQVFTTNSSKIIPVDVDTDGMSLNDPNINDADILCITPSHQFPTGGIMPISRRVQLINWANSSLERYIIEDDYDSEFKYSGRPIPALQGLDTNGKVIYLGSFSKSLSPTIRISYMVLPQHLMEKYIKNLSFMLCSAPLIDQKVLYRFINDGYFERHLNKMRIIYRKKYDTLVRSITELHRNIEILGADAGLHVLLKISNGMSENKLVQKARDYGVEVYGISNYFFESATVTDFPTVLLGYATMNESEIKSAINLLSDAWFRE